MTTVQHKAMLLSVQQTEDDSLLCPRLRTSGLMVCGPSGIFVIFALPCIQVGYVLDAH